jgi:hypothetical protein
MTVVGDFARLLSEHEPSWSRGAYALSPLLFHDGWRVTYRLPPDRGEPSFQGAVDTESVVMMGGEWEIVSTMCLAALQARRGAWLAQREWRRRCTWPA